MPFILYFINSEAWWLQCPCLERNHPVLRTQLTVAPGYLTPTLTIQYTSQNIKPPPFDNSHSWAQDGSLRLFNPRCTIYPLLKAQVSFVAGGDACHTILPSQIISSFVILEKAWSTGFKMMMKSQEQHWPTEQASTLLWVIVCAGTPFTRSFTVVPTLPKRREDSHL